MSKTRKKPEAKTMEIIVFKRKPRAKDWWNAQYYVRGYTDEIWSDEMKHILEFIGEQSQLILEEME
jgi:hypothetical protein